MKSLIVLASLLAVTLGSLNSENVGAPIAPIVKIPLRGGQYRMESASPDGSVAGQYGYQIDGQTVQVTYSTAGQTPNANNDKTYTTGATSEVATADDSKIEDSPKTEDTKTTTPVGATVPLQTVTTPVSQTYGASYPTAQLPTYYYHVKPVPSGFYPTQQQFSYSQSSPYVPVTGQTFPSYYFPNFISGQQYPQPTYSYSAGANPNIGSSLVSTGQVYTPGQAGQVYTTGQAGQVHTPVTTVYQTSGTAGQPGQLPTPVTTVYQTSGAHVTAGQSGATTYTGQGETSQVFQKAVVTPTTGQVYSGQSSVSTISKTASTTPLRSSGTYSLRYGYPTPTFSYRSYYPLNVYPGFAQSYGYPRLQYRVNRY